MALIHGNKVYAQVLVDPNRFKILEDLAKRSGKRTTGLIRDIVYECLDLYIDPELVRIAEEKDAEIWRQSVKNRVAGRLNNKAHSAVRNTDVEA